MRTRRPTTRRPAFTLTELIVVMGIITVLATLTLVSVKVISGDARLASATNMVTAALDNARALAMRRNTIVLVVFRPRMVSEREQRTEVLTARWTGQSYVNPNVNVGVIDRFEPVPEVPIRTLPEGIKVAAPRYEYLEDFEWVTQAQLPTDPTNPSQTLEVPGALIAIMFGPDGTTLTRNSQSDSDRTWVDFKLEIAANDPSATPQIHDGPNLGDFVSPALITNFVDHVYADDECFVTVAPFLSVYDDRSARELRTTDWTADPDYRAELTGPDGYISRVADRLHFNRYTGVSMR